MAALDWEKRRKFAAHYVATGNAARAARAAGVPAKSARVVGHQWLRHPDVLDLLRVEIDATIRTLAAPALAALRRLIEDDATPAPTRLAAARDVLDRLGHMPPKRTELEVNITSKTLQELTVEELYAIARSGSKPLLEGDAHEVCIEDENAVALPGVPPPPPTTPTFFRTWG